jgi:hypothetical protein
MNELRQMQNRLCYKELLGSLDFFRRPVFFGVGTRRFGNCICSRPQVKWGRRHLLSWAP